MKLFLCQLVFFKNDFHNKAKKVCLAFIHNCKMPHWYQKGRRTQKMKRLEAGNICCFSFLCVCFCFVLFVCFFVFTWPENNRDLALAYAFLWDSSKPLCHYFYFQLNCMYLTFKWMLFWCLFSGSNGYKGMDRARDTAVVGGTRNK